jgi:hypothetical protein
MSRASLAIAAHAVLERGQLLDANWPARVHLARRNANFRSHAEFAAIGKLCRCIMQ